MDFPEDFFKKKNSYGIGVIFKNDGIIVMIERKDYRTVD